DREQRRRDLAVKQGRPQQDASDDLAEHRRLAEPLGRQAKQPGEQDDNGQVGQEQLDFLICHRASLPKHKFARPARARALQYPAVIPPPALMELATCSAWTGLVRAAARATSPPRSRAAPARCRWRGRTARPLSAVAQRGPGRSADLAASLYLETEPPPELDVIGENRINQLDRDRAPGPRPAKEHLTHPPASRVYWSWLMSPGRCCG